MTEIEMIAMLPRPKGATLEDMVVEAYIAKTGKYPSDEFMKSIEPEIKRFQNIKPKPIQTRPKKWRG